MVARRSPGNDSPNSGSPVRSHDRPSRRGCSRSLCRKWNEPDSRAGIRLPAGRGRGQTDVCGSDCRSGVRALTLNDLKARLNSFSPAQIEFVATVVDSLSNPLIADKREVGNWLTGTSAWIEYFGLALSVHHSAAAEPSGLTAFESVFRNACQHVEWTVDPPGSRTRRFVDPTAQTDVGPERRLSLKSTAAKDLKEDSAHISKLTEAAWVQDASTGTARRNEMGELFRQYQVIGANFRELDLA